MSGITRRGFNAAAATVASYSRILGANDRVNVGYIGLGNRGDQVHDAFLEHGDQQTVAVCDLRDDYMDFAVKKSRATPVKYNDYRKVIEDKNVDAVAIATPDHWHAIMCIEACRAGKDVYVEKPLSLTIAEGRRMVEVARETKRVTQCGIHRRSVKSLQEAAAFIRGGGLGEVTVAKGYHVQNEYPNGIGMAPDGAAPNEEMWEKWLGPAPKAAWNLNRTFYNFRWFYDYSGGQITNFGVHYMDFFRSALGEATPRSVTAMGGRYAVKDNREIPDTCEVLYDFGKTLVVFVQYNANGAPTNLRNSELEVRGTKGTMYLQSGRWVVVPEKTTEVLFGQRTPLNRGLEKGYGPSKKLAMEPAQGGSGFAETTWHTRNFLDCIKSRQKCNCDIEIGHLSTSACIIGHIALRTRSLLDWDAKAEKFTNNDTANRLLSYKYRAPYKLG
jgi:predicted dehydrogenase